MNGAYRSRPQIAGPTVNATCRLRSQDQMEELAAAFDGLAETLKEKSAQPDGKLSLQQRSEQWLVVLSQFSRALRRRENLSSIQDLLMATVEHAFPECVATFSAADDDRRGETNPYGKPDQESKRLEPVAEVEKDRMVARAGWVPEPGSSLRRSKAEEWRKRDQTSSTRIPLIAGGEAWGTLSVFTRERRMLTRLEFEFLTLLADQAALAMHDAQVRRRMEEQKVELWEVKDALRHAQASKAEFLGILSHEFRTPLNLIMGYTEIIQEELAEKITAEQRGYLKRILKASDDVLALILSALHAGSIEAGCVDIIKEEVGLSAILGELRSELERPQEKNVDFLWDIPADLPVISTDAEKLKHVLHKLIDNAFKFTERGQVKVSSKNVSRIGKVEIAVSDSGVGISSDAFPELFEPYRQLDASVTRRHDGLGVGLFIANKFTEMLGGELKVASEPGKGSTFTVALPVGV